MKPTSILASCTVALLCVAVSGCAINPPPPAAPPSAADCHLVASTNQTVKDLRVSDCAGGLARGEGAGPGTGNSTGPAGSGGR